MRPRLRLAEDAGDIAPERQTTPIRVVLADHHGIVRRSIRQLLQNEKDIRVVGETANLESTLERLAAVRPDVVLLDLNLPNAPGVAGIRQLRDSGGHAEVIVMTMEESSLSALRAIDAGAAGFIVKDRADSELLPAIRCVARGEEYVSAQVVSGVDALRRAGTGDALSPRETNIVRLIALGHTSAEIARMLELSRRTVETHRAQIYKKLNLTTRAELVQFALRRHLIG